jgi:hypothetical protein
MKYATLLVIAVLLFGFSACDSGVRQSQPAGIAANTESAKTYDAQALEKREVAGVASTNSVSQTQSNQSVSLNDAAAADTASQAFDRKIIRNANLTIEVSSPGDIQRKIASIAESHQGFVVTSEANQRTGDDKTKPEVTVNLVVRLPAAQFNAAMEAIRGVAQRMIQEKVIGQDVTEEFMDLEARIKNQKALESQFIEIMKRAGKVDDALSVQRELAEVRTDIEKLEGRRRFLENQASLSTINVTLQPPTPIVNTTGFWYSVRSAFSDGMDVASGVVLFVIRAVIALVPIILLIVLPLLLVLKFGLRVFGKRFRRAPATAGVSPE